MAPLSHEVAAPGQSSVPNARAFVRSLNVLLKFARLYGLEHTRSATQFDSAWGELREAVRNAPVGGLLLGASGSQLLLDGEPLESTQAERSFADLLNGAGVASICFSPSVERDEFANLVRAFMESGPKAPPLSDRLERYFGKDHKSGIRVNEIRFVAEDAGFSEARVAAQLTIKTLGGDAEKVQDWFRSPEKMIQLIAAAEGSHGGGTGSGGNGPGGDGPGSGSGGVFYGASASDEFVPGGTAVGFDAISLGAGLGPGSGGGLGQGFGPGPGLAKALARVSRISPIWPASRLLRCRCPRCRKPRCRVCSNCLRSLARPARARNSTRWIPRSGSCASPPCRPTRRSRCGKRWRLSLRRRHRQ
jgi:hypothetical protein